MGVIAEYQHACAQYVLTVCLRVTPAIVAISSMLRAESFQTITATLPLPLLAHLSTHTRIGQATAHLQLMFHAERGSSCSGLS